MRPEVLLDALRRAGATFCDEAAPQKEPITKADLYAAGLSGGANSAEKRKALLKKLDLPEKLSSNALLDVLNVLWGRETFLAEMLVDEGGGERGA